ncbi:hypothetical protein FC36_GL001120 [Ligilactobacillus equi DSM 15833 = JCM 10991]|uniref:Uncharacterized protein n=1 Tax=Ligilactobacillus equi DSM 15833 = JCM 10991 TaxID=1423740 RepID=A0A0R1TGL8_9LACO|nr:hypothetical protein [Ligilactobacillus equi]KRL78234.1 hypothetical protein FC36_GL001120 [Ligilactobacillus equi DSM 15833 = JCM 10991]
MVKESQKHASRAWEKRNPERTSYLALRRATFNFVHPKPGTKAERAIQANWDDYIDDLDTLNHLLEQQKTMYFNGKK